MIFLQLNVKKLLDRHFYLLLLIPLIFIVQPLAEPGISITGDFPYLDTPDYASNGLWLWLEKGSIDGLEFLPRFAFIGSWYLLGFIGITSELATKSMVLLGFFLSSFTFYFSFLFFFKDKSTHYKTALKISALMGSIFYAYNVWSFNRIHHWYLWIGYSILPLFFISIFFSFKNPKDWRYIISSIFLWSIASTTPHMTLFYGFILLVTFLGFIFNNLKNKKIVIIRLVIPFMVIISSYFLVNMYWIYPYILASQTQVLTPNYELTEEILEILSRESNFFNTFRILAYWLISDVVPPDNSTSYFLWTWASLVIPITAFSALFLRKSIKYALFFSGIALTAIFLAMGSQSPFDYYELVLGYPALSRFAWLLRDSDKWSFAILFAYSFLVGMVSYKVFSIASKEKHYNKKKILISCSFILLLLGSILVTSYPFYKTRMDPLKPVILPDEFHKLNGYLSKISNDKIFFIPYPLYETEWDKVGRVGPIYQAHSIKPSIQATEYNFAASNYYNFLANSILENRSRNISNLIYPLGTSYVIFHNDTWSKNIDSYDPRNINLLKKLYLLDLKNISNIGFYKVFKTSNDDKNYPVGQVNIPSQNIAILGGLDTLNSLNTISSFNTLNSSAFFLDDMRTKNTNVSKSLDALILDRSSSDDEFSFYFIDDKYIIAPFDATIRHDPGELWSRSRARDPTHAEFHPYLEKLGIENWEFDYGKGLVITKAMGAKLSIPLEIGNENKTINSKDNNFYLFMRYLKNQKGGSIKIYIDNALVKEVNTLDKITNDFVSERIVSINLAQGKHTLTLENVAGFNAINLFASIPRSEVERLTADTDHLLAGRVPVIYLLEAESNFYNDKGMHTGYFHNLLGYNSNVSSHNSKSSFAKTFSGQFKVPENSDLLAIQFLAKKKPNSNSSYSIKDLEVAPAYQKYNIFTSDFERKKDSVPLATLRHSDLINYDKDLISTSLEINRPISGNSSLRVDLRQGDKSGWSILSTDFIPINNEAYYNATLDISAKDVKQLHSRILYFDSNGKELTKATDYIFKGKDGTFRDTYTSGIVPPKEARYLKFQVLALSANPETSSYVLDNVKMDEITDPTGSKNNFLNEDQNVIDVNEQDYSNTNVKNNGSIFMIQTKPFPVKQDRIYNYTITTEAKNVTAYSAVASFRNSGDVSENSTRYGNNASNGNVLSLSPGSGIYTNLDILKPSNYTIALRARTCETCSFLTVGIERTDDEADMNTNNIQTSTISLKDKDSGLKWLYSNSTYRLNKGTYELRIYSDSQTDLDSVIVYPVHNFRSKVTEDSNQTLKDLFNVNSPAAKVSGFKKINPTKYVLDIENATRPYTISLAEAYDPLWTAYEEGSGENDNFKINSFPLFGIVNGFYVTKTGNYTLVLEYQPQNWFIQGATVSILALLLMLVVSILHYKKVKIDKLYKLVTSIKKYIRNNNQA
jgi:hypothetical protein